MARYGFGAYGGSLYGQVDTNKIIYDAKLAVSQVDYRTNLLTWSNVSIESSDLSLTHWKIVKTVGGAPDTPNDSFFVVGDTMANILSPGTFEDYEDYFPAETEVTYSFWVFNGADWLYCGSADSIVVSDDADTTYKIMKRLPGSWTNASRYTADATGEPDTGTGLWKFLNSFSFYYDKLRTQTGVINNLSDYRKYPHLLLPTVIDSMGFEYEPTLGDAYHRALYRSGNIINSLKGSKLGLELYTTALTHYPATVRDGNNLMLDYNDSSFEESLGSWESESYLETIQTVSLLDHLATITLSGPHNLQAGDIVTILMFIDTNFNGTFEIVSIPDDFSFTYAIPTADDVEERSSGGRVYYTRNSIVQGLYADAPGLTGLYEPLLPPEPLFSTPVETATYLPRKQGYATVSFNALEETVTLNSFMTDKTITRTIPVSEGVSYHFCGYAKSLLSTGTNPSVPSVWAIIEWFDKTGALITDKTGTPLITYGNSALDLHHDAGWKYFECSNVDIVAGGGSVGIIAPPGACYAGPKLQFAHGDPDRQIAIDMLSFSVYPGTTGNQVELVSEGLFEDARQSIIEVDGIRTNLIVNPGFENGTGGWIPKPGSNLAEDNTYSVFGTQCAKLTHTSGENFITSDWMQVEPDTDYTFSIYALSDVESAHLRIEFDSAKYAVDQETILSDEDGQYFYTGDYYVDSEKFTLSNTQFTRLHVSARSPEYSIDSGKPLAKVSIISENGTHSYFDAALFESGDTLLPFFQGNGGLDPENILTDDFFPVVDFGWESKIRANLLTSSYNWVGDFNLASSAEGGLVVPKFDDHFLKVTAGSDPITASVKYPWRSIKSYSQYSTPFGGEPMSLSAYVCAPVAGDYVITISSDGYASNSYSSTVHVEHPNVWTRIHVVGYMGKAQYGVFGPVPFNVLCSIEFTDGTHDWYVNAPQLEFGENPTPFLDPNYAQLVDIDPVYHERSAWLISGPMGGGGRSYYWTRKEKKFTRLQDTASKFLPIGSSFKISRGAPEEPNYEPGNSLLKSSSFENNLYGWQNEQNLVNMTRHVSRGSLFTFEDVSNRKDKASSGKGFIKLEPIDVVDYISYAPGDGYDLIAWQEGINVKPRSQYVISAAYMVADPNGTSPAPSGTVTLSVTWFDKDFNSTEGPVFTAVSSGQHSIDSPGDPARWKYVGGNAISPEGVVYAKLQLAYAADVKSDTDRVFFDRVVFRRIS